MDARAVQNVTGKDVTGVANLDIESCAQLVQIRNRNL
jgi:hypothetical protein